MVKVAKRHMKVSPLVLITFYVLPRNAAPARECIKYSFRDNNNMYTRGIRVYHLKATSMTLHR